MSCLLYPEERALGDPRTGGWVGLRADLDAVENREVSAPAME